MERMKTVLNDIRALGVKLALDDFGTGYSSLNHIREIPLDVIKVDRCFIEHIGEDEFSDAFLNMVTELAHTLGVRVCVEGVENSSQCESVRKKDVQMIQGFYFGKPMKIDEFEKRYVV
jgi:EAL domain-containing protein (putative c-di-GMP-specific phosphodiesterase class I)